MFYRLHRCSAVQGKEGCAKTFSCGHFNIFCYLWIIPQSFRRMINFLLQKIWT